VVPRARSTSPDRAAVVPRARSTSPDRAAEVKITPRAASPPRPVENVVTKVDPKKPVRARKPNPFVEAQSKLLKKYSHVPGIYDVNNQLSMLFLAVKKDRVPRPTYDKMVEELRTGDKDVNYFIQATKNIQLQRLLAGK